MKKLFLVLVLGMSSLFASSMSAWLNDANKTTQTHEMKAKNKVYTKCGGVGKYASKQTSKSSAAKCGTVNIPTH
jgi:hypothetical protein